MEKDTFKQRRQMLADMILNNELYVPMKAKEIAMLLDIPKAKRSELMEVLDSLVADGTIGVSKKGKYMKPENVDLFIINGVECEPYLTADYKNMMENLDLLKTGALAFLKLSKAKKGCISVKEEERLDCKTSRNFQWNRY